MSFPFRLNITTIVKRRATRVTGLILGTNSRWYHRADPGNELPVVPLPPLQLHADETGQRTSEKRDAQVDEDALRDLPHADLHEASLEAENGGDREERL